MNAKIKYFISKKMIILFKTGKSFSGTQA